jgi:UDP-N-acetylmuramate dehydrogenase
LRRPDPPPICLLGVRLTLLEDSGKAIYDRAREFQRQRIGKQPAPASAGSFFKHVESRELAESLTNLPDGLKAAGIVPSGYLIEAAGLKGTRHKGAMLSTRHANFILNVDNATASSIRSLAEFAKKEVHALFGVVLEEEVLYLGDWSQFEPETVAR